MKIFKYIFFVIFLVSIFSFSQNKIEEREGTVTFVSSQYIYVKFENMEGIYKGDTLYVKQGKK